MPPEINAASVYSLPETGELVAVIDGIEYLLDGWFIL